MTKQEYDDRMTALQCSIERIDRHTRIVKKCFDVLFIWLMLLVPFICIIGFGNMWFFRTLLYEPLLLTVHIWMHTFPDALLEE